MTYWHELKNPYLGDLENAWHPVSIRGGKVYAPWWASLTIGELARYVCLVMGLSSLLMCIMTGDLWIFVGAVVDFLLAWSFEDEGENQ